MSSSRVRKSLIASALTTVLLSATPAHAEERSFDAGSLIIPMDLSFQDSGLFQAYGLLFQLLRQGVPVYWIIDENKTWHSSDCDTPGDECSWDCREQGSEIKCPYPTGSPDFFAGAQFLWDSEGEDAPGTVIVNHGYRGGPFVIDATNRDAALAVIDVWNNPDTWDAAPWASRTIFNVVTVHEATAAFSGWVRKRMVAAPTIAVFSDGNEDIATGYLRAAGIPQSNGQEFLDGKCGDGECGPGTDNPDMLTVPSIMGDMGTCDAINYDHKNGALFTDDGLPAFCQIMSMHWNVNDRETVECDGGACPAEQDQCAGETITYHGHEVVAEVRAFLQYPVHFFAECQAVNAYENTVPNPAWPYLDDPGRNGHFLTTTGNPPACPCTDNSLGRGPGGCDGGATDCCLPSNDKELGAGFMIADQPDAAMLKILYPDVPYNQFDGPFRTVGGSEPAYNLSPYLGTQYKNDRDVTFITGPVGPGDQDLWMTGFMDGECDITGSDDVGVPAGECNGGKVSYLGGHRYAATTPMSANPDAQGTRLFLNAQFEADCVTSIGQPNITLSLQGDLVLPAQSVPAEGTYIAGYDNLGRGPALDAVLANIVPANVDVTGASDDGTVGGNGVEWSIGSISTDAPLAGDPPNQGTRTTSLRFPDFGEYQLEVQMNYRVGQSFLPAPSQSVTVRVALDSDGDNIPDDDDPEPDDAQSCGDSDQDTCDDCSVSGTFDPNNDGPDADNDGICDAGEGLGIDGDPDGCGCRTTSSADAAPWLFAVLLLALRRRSNTGVQ